MSASASMSRNRQTGAAGSRKKTMSVVRRQSRGDSSAKTRTAGVLLGIALTTALVLLMCCVSMVAGNEVKGLGFYPPFKTYNARGQLVKGVPGVVLLHTSMKCSNFSAQTGRALPRLQDSA